MHLTGECLARSPAGAVLADKDSRAGPRFALMLRPANWLALLSRTFTFKLSPVGTPRANVEYDYLGKTVNSHGRDFHRQVQRHYGLRSSGLTPAAC
jgi:hypothetical protein